MAYFSEADKTLVALRDRIKRYPVLRQIAYSLINSSFFVHKRGDALFDKIGSAGYILNIGSGYTDYGARVINLDLHPCEGVTVVGDAHRLPFKDGSIAGVISEVTLEHIPSPKLSVEEMFRVLRTGGYLYADIPFIQGYHGSPEDYGRFTISGVRQLFKQFHEIEAGVGAGPSSAFVWILKEYLAILFSFNVQGLYVFLTLFFGVLLMPLKCLDLIIGRYKNAHVISAVLFFLGEKPSAHAVRAQGTQQPLKK